MQESKRGARGAKVAKRTGHPRRVSLRIAITLPAALHLEAKRKASSLSMSFSEYMRSLIRKDLEGSQQ
jgi:predicted DNA binding CopG/RHH family protein